MQIRHAVAFPFRFTDSYPVQLNQAVHTRITLRESSARENSMANWRSSGWCAGDRPTTPWICAVLSCLARNESLRLIDGSLCTKYTPRRSLRQQRARAGLRRTLIPPAPCRI